MATKYDKLLTLGRSWDALVFTINATNDTGTSVTLTDAGILQVQQTVGTPITASPSILLTQAQALWLADQITRIMVTDDI